MPNHEYKTGSITRASANSEFSPIDSPFDQASEPWRVGSWNSGAYRAIATNQFLHPFAFMYEGDFSWDDCNSIAKKAANWIAENSEHLTTQSQSVTVPQNRAVVIGFCILNEENKFQDLGWVGIRLKTKTLEISFPPRTITTHGSDAFASFGDKNKPHSDFGWHVVRWEAYSFYVKYADNDAGGLMFRFSD